MLSTRNHAWNWTLFDLHFDQKVSITESFYPPLSFSELFSSIGGALGLWLGVGVMQIFGYASSFGECLIFVRKKYANKE